MVKEPPKPQEPQETPGSTVKSFLASRGLLIIKEFRPINVVKCEYGTRINLETAIISTMASATIPGKVSYGVKFEMQDTQGDEQGSAFLDLDEFDEVISALEFINKLALEMANQQRDYTEVNFVTKDDIKFGFFQSEGRQLAFTKLQSYGNSAYLNLNMLKFVKENLEWAKSYLISRGAVV